MSWYINKSVYKIEFYENEGKSTMYRFLIHFHACTVHHFFSQQTFFTNLQSAYPFQKRCYAPAFITWKSCSYDYISPGWMPAKDKICVRGHLEKTLHRMCIFRKTNDVFPLCTRLENSFMKNWKEITPSTSSKLFETIGTLP